MGLGRRAFLGLLPVAAAAATMAEPAGADAMERVLTDFGTGAGAVPAQAWYAVSDRVMGGVSREAAGLEQVGDRMAMRLTGFVSSANNGGFIMLGCPLPAGLGAAEWTGLRLTVRGAGDGYRVTLRTADTRRPWEHYAQPLPVATDWRTVDLPFAGFQPNRALPPMDLEGLTRIGLVAGGKDAPADLAVARVVIYR